ncbi:MAG: riboflavin synthase [Deltaproteobacteria bacterium]|nr:MAG: riboflavin synthase [Deltaproteobacteria bacterium]
MFTGIIERTGTITHIERKGEGAVFEIATDWPPSSYQIGESIAVNGICLTVVHFEADGQGSRFRIDASPETVQRTTMPDWRLGRRVNLERPLSLSNLLGGHLVTGHIDGCGRVVRIEEEEGPMPGRIVTLEIPPELARYMIFKGSVAVDGVSLTVHACDASTLALNLVPHTLEVTTFGTCRVGDRMNIEVDIIGKYVEKFLHWLTPEDLERLRRERSE